MPVRTEIHEGLVPVKIYTGEIEPAARLQLVNISKLPFVFHHVAAMPDVHLGIGATVGSVIATRGAICPAAVGVDIGWGMVAQKTSVLADYLNTADLKRIRSEVERSIPVGHHSHKQPLKEGEEYFGRTDAPSVSTADEMKRALCQLGTLGGGNHFIEVCVDQDDRSIWLLLHSGSRNIGKTVAER